MCAKRHYFRAIGTELTPVKYFERDYNLIIYFILIMALPQKIRSVSGKIKH